MVLLRLLGTKLVLLQLPLFAFAFTVPAPPLRESGDLESTAVYGLDNRLLVFSSVYPWSAIGKLSTSSVFCTATLISSCHVLTAAHCLVDRRGRPYTNRIYFISSAGGSRARAQRFIYGPYWRDDRHDWAILRLGRNLGLSMGYFTLLWRDGAALAKSGPYTIAGYNSDFADGRLVSADMAVWIRYAGLDRAANVLYFQGNTHLGSSGAAIWAWNYRAGRAEIIGINTRAKVGETASGETKQYYFPGDSFDPDDLATGVATAQFWDPAMRFMERTPCQ